MVARLVPAELKRHLDARSPLVLLDVREPFERALAAIPASDPAIDLFFPLREIPERLDEIGAALARCAGPLIVYCHHGVRSEMVAGWLASRGLRDVRNLDGGIDAYSQQADPGVPRY
jgi:rhodanese-related sulfurtransferase